MLCFFFFKQKTAYEMRISDWSSDVCSSDLESKRFAHVNSRLRRFAMRAAIANAAMSPFAQFLIALSVAAVIAVALYQANSGTLTVGTFASFMAALAQIFDPIKRLTNIAGRMQRQRESAPEKRRVGKRGGRT